MNYCPNHPERLIDPGKKMCSECAAAEVKEAFEERFAVDVPSCDICVSAHVIAKTAEEAEAKVKAAFEEREIEISHDIRLNLDRLWSKP